MNKTVILYATSEHPLSVKDKYLAEAKRWDIRDEPVRLKNKIKK